MTPDASTPSAAYLAMREGWRTIEDILAGPATIRAAGERYLPKYPAEDKDEYERRLKQAPWRPEFEDAHRSLSSKPFGKDVALKDGASERIKEIAEDVDAAGNNLTAFAREVFRRGVAKGMHAILVDYPTMAPGATQAEEKQAGVRPYWVSVPAESIIALYTETVAGKEIVSHVRVLEKTVERDGFGEREVERVRVIEPGRWQLWERGKDRSLSLAAEGQMTLPLVPLALFWTGERAGPQFVRPPLAALADMQVELFRKLSRQDEIETYAGSPMLAGQGISPPGESDPPLKIGPKQVLFAPPDYEGARTGWEYIQPDAANLKEIRESVRETIDDMRRLGMQPMAQKSGGVTAAATLIEGAKVHSTVEAWAIGLKDTLEQAFVFTTQWLGEEPTVEVEVDTDFSVDPYAQAPLGALSKARATKDISQRTYWQGLRRFDVLPPDFDPDAEELALAEEVQGLDGEEPIDPRTGATFP